MDPQVASGDDEFFDFPEDSSSSETINEDEEVKVKIEPVVDEEELKKQQAARFAQLALKTSHKKADASDLEELFFNYCKYAVYLHVYGRPTPLESTDSDSVFLHKSLGAFFHFQSDLFVKQLRPLQERLRSGVRVQLLQRVDGDEKDPLVVFFDAMCHHREMHMVNPKTNPIRSRKQTSADELVTTIIDAATKTAIEFDLTGKNHGKRELTLSQLPSDDDSGAVDNFQAGLDHRLAMTANGEKEHKLMSIMVPHDLANLFRIIHSFIHFFNYTDALMIAGAASGTPPSHFEELWVTLMGEKHISKRIKQLPATNATRMVKAIVRCRNVLHQVVKFIDEQRFE